MKLTKIAFAGAVLFSTNLYAVDVNFDNQCNVELNSDLTITPQHILIKENDETVVDIYKDNMLFIRGNQISLDKKQTKLLMQYSASIRETVPEVAEIAVEAVEIAFEGINTGLGQFVDMGETEEKFDEIKARIRDKFDSQDGHYSFTNGNFSTTIDDHGIDEMVEEVVDDMVPKLIGSVLANIGSAMAKGETDFNDLNNLDQRIERAIEDKADQLEEKAESFCNRLKEVDELEESLIASNSKLRQLDLITFK